MKKSTLETIGLIALAIIIVVVSGVVYLEGYRVKKALAPILQFLSDMVRKVLPEAGPVSQTSLSIGATILFVVAISLFYVFSAYKKERKDLAGRLIFVLLWWITLSIWLIGYRWLGYLSLIFTVLVLAFAMLELHEHDRQLFALSLGFLSFGLAIWSSYLCVPSAVPWTLWVVLPLCLFLGFSRNPYDWLPVLVLFVVLTFAAVPKYMVYRDKQAVMEALHLVNPLHETIEKRLAEGKPPLKINKLPAGFQEAGIKAITVSNTGQIEVTFGQVSRDDKGGKPAQSQDCKYKRRGFQGRTLVFVPAVGTGKSAEWKCVGGTLDDKYRPEFCRSKKKD
jgi:hypothetical protein